MFFFYYYYFKVLIFWVVSEVSMQIRVQNDKNMSIMLCISGTIPHTIVICGKHV